jgi:dTMP kinase
MKGKFIVLEGIDGSGSSTQARLLIEKFESCNSAVHLTSEPSPGPIGNMIRQGMSGRLSFSEGGQSDGSMNLFDQQMAYLFAADRHDHLYNSVNGVFKNLRSGTHVVSTRYYFSSLAYHASSEEESEFVKSLNSNFPEPDLLIYLDCPVEQSISRLSKRTFADAYENSEKLKIVRENYSRIIDNYKGRLLVVDAVTSPQELGRLIWDEVCGMIGDA